MPCLDEGRSDYEHQQMTQALCHVMRCYEAGESVEHVLETNRWLEVWWAHHKEADRRREAQAQADRERLQIIEGAIGKLTDRELIAMGINVASINAARQRAAKAKEAMDS